MERGGGRGGGVGRGRGESFVHDRIVQITPPKTRNVIVMNAFVALILLDLEADHVPDPSSEKLR